MALFIDVKNAFPTVSKERLIHNLWKRWIPTSLTHIIHSFLSDRCTSVICDDYVSDQATCKVGIPQGSPLSSILYLFYNANLSGPSLHLGAALSQSPMPVVYQVTGH